MEKYHIKYQDIDSKSQHKISLSSVIPRPIAWISTINDNGTINLAPFSFFTVLSPTLMVVSFTQVKNKHKDTYRNILRNKEAVVNIGNVSLVEMIDRSSESLDYNVSEVDLLNLDVSESMIVKVPYLKLAPISFEVTLESFTNFNKANSEEVESNVVFLRILAVHISKDIYDIEKSYLSLSKINPISRLNGTLYGASEKLKYKRNYT